MINYWNFQSLTSIGPINAFTEYLFSNMHEVLPYLKDQNILFISKENMVFSGFHYLNQWCYLPRNVEKKIDVDTRNNQQWKNFSLKCHIVSVVQTNAVSYNTLYLYIFSFHPSEAFLWFYIYVCSRVPLVPRNVMVFQFFVSRHNFLWNHRLLMIYPSTP